MARFLHEYLHYPNGTVVDNGWWEIVGNRLYNRAGGHHDYDPQPDDEIREGTWEEILRDAVRDNNQITGWIAPDGTFYGCTPTGHSDIARYVLGATERELEKRGYAKIFENPFELRKRGFDKYECIRVDMHQLTEGQKRVLRDKGINHTDFYNG